MAHKFDFKDKVVVNAPRLGLNSKDAIVKSMGINMEGQRFYQVQVISPPTYRHIVSEDELSNYESTGELNEFNRN